MTVSTSERTPAAGDELGSGSPDASAVDRARTYLRRLEEPGFFYSNLERSEAESCYRGERMAFYPSECLLQQIRKPIRPDEFPFVTERRENPDWSEEALREEIERLGHWEYYLEFSHGLTTEISATFNERTKEFHRYRSKLISETVCDLLGDELGDAEMLDLGCHCGVMSLDLAHRGAKHVRGIEVRDKNLAKAEFLKSYYGISNVDFERGDVDTLQSDRPCDVVLCLGLLYHVVHPIDLLEFCYRNSRKFAVIDTICHKEPISAYHVVGQRDTKVSIEGTRTIELHPTYRAIIDSMREVGFDHVVEAVGECNTEIELYSDYTRRCFIGFK